MSSKLLLSIAAFILGLPGIFLLFAPDLALASIGGNPLPDAQLFTQLAGGLAFALGINNWMARGAVIGGIYGRPLLMTDLCAFFIMGLGLLKAPGELGSQPIVIAAGVLYLLCGLAFGRLLFRHTGT